MFKSKSKVKEKIEENLKEIKEVSEIKLKESITEIEERLKMLQRELIENKTVEETTKIGNEIVELREEKDTLQTKFIYNKEYASNMDEIKKLLDETKITLKEFDEKIVRKLVKNVTIMPGSIIVTFKTNTEIEV